MSPTITRIRDVNEFMVAVSVKERIAACLAVFIKKLNPTGNIGRTTTATNQQSYEGKTLLPGMIKELNPGEDVFAVNPTGQAADATSFVKIQERLIGAGQGISYETVARDMSESNYSSARQGLIEDGLTYTEEMELLQEVMDEIYETFIISCVLAGVLNIKDFWNSKEEYLSHEWIQAPKKWIDPIKEANANKIAMQTGQKTFKQIAAENGKDYKEQIDDMAEVINYGRSKGIELGGVIFGQKQNNDESAGSKTEPKSSKS
jgi:lambda family phage portal protein